MEKFFRELTQIEDMIRNYDIYKHCMYMPTKEKYKIKVNEWLQDEHIKIYACFKEEMIKGVIVVLLQSEQRAEILGISVAANSRGQGIGSYMIQKIRERYCLVELRAETDDDAIAFYEKCGFRTRVHTEIYNGESVVRYECILS